MSILQSITPPLTHVEIPRLRDATEMNNDSMLKLGDVYCQTEPNLSFFSERDSISDESSFCSLIFSAVDKQCRRVFKKAFVKCSSVSENGIFDDVSYEDVVENWSKTCHKAEHLNKKTPGIS